MEFLHRGWADVCSEEEAKDLLRAAVALDVKVLGDGDIVRVGNGAAAEEVINILNIFA